MSQKRRRLIILTLEKHKDGIWIRRLIEALRRRTSEIDTNITGKRRRIVISDAADDDDKRKRTKTNSFTDNDDKNHKEEEEEETMIIKIDVQSLEGWLGEGWMVSSSSLSSPDSSNKNSSSILDKNVIIGIVNRVSDAANPILYKACCAILNAAQVMEIPIVNGPTSYAMCGNKWCHHILFQQAKLHSPKTIAFFGNDDGEDKNNKNNVHGGSTNTNRSVLQGKIQDTFINNYNDDDGDPTLLIKPNAGGFGAGIQSVKATSLLQKEHNKNRLPIFDDSMTLLQSYETPLNNKLYRIWFLNGKVQCAIERSIIDVDNDSQFTSGCAGSNVCSIQQRNHQQQKQQQQQQPVPNNKAWKIPLNVQEEIENQLLPLLKDAFTGSVEFLYSSSTTKKTQQQNNINKDNNNNNNNKDCNKRLYFDLNLLSTLPIDDVSNEDDVWEEGYDPWIELAEAIWEILIPCRTNSH